MKVTKLPPPVFGQVQVKAPVAGMARLYSAMTDFQETWDEDHPKAKPSDCRPEVTLHPWYKLPDKPKSGDVFTLTHQSCRGETDDRAFLGFVAAKLGLGFFTEPGVSVTSDTLKPADIDTFLKTPPPSFGTSGSSSPPAVAV